VPPQAELPRDDGAARTRDDVRADLRELSFREIGIALEELAGDGELEDAVAEELEALVRRSPVGRPGGVGEDVLLALGRKLVDQTLERSGRGAPRVRELCLTGAR